MIPTEVVMTGAGGFVEVREPPVAPFSRNEMDALLVLAETGIAQLVAKKGRWVPLV